MKELIIKNGSYLDLKLMEVWKYTGEWCVFVKNLDEAILRVYGHNCATVVEFATDEDITMFTLRWG